MIQKVEGNFSKILDDLRCVTSTAFENLEVKFNTIKLEQESLKASSAHLQSYLDSREMKNDSGRGDVVGNEYIFAEISVVRDELKHHREEHTASLKEVNAQLDKRLAEFCEDSHGRVSVLENTTVTLQQVLADIQQDVANQSKLIDPLSLRNQSSQLPESEGNVESKLKNNAEVLEHILPEIKKLKCQCAEVTTLEAAYEDLRSRVQHMGGQIDAMHFKAEEQVPRSSPDSSSQIEATLSKSSLHHVTSDTRVNEQLCAESVSRFGSDTQDRRKRFVEELRRESSLANGNLTEVVNKAVRSSSRQSLSQSLSSLGEAEVCDNESFPSAFGELLPKLRHEFMSHLEVACRDLQTEMNQCVHGVGTALSDKIESLDHVINSRIQDAGPARIQDAGSSRSRDAGSTEARTSPTRHTGRHASLSPLRFTQVAVPNRTMGLTIQTRPGGDPPSGMIGAHDHREIGRGPPRHTSSLGSPCKKTPSTSFMPNLGEEHFKNVSLSNISRRTSPSLALVPNTMCAPAPARPGVMQAPANAHQQHLKQSSLASGVGSPPSTVRSKHDVPSPQRTPGIEQVVCAIAN